MIVNIFRTTISHSRARRLTAMFMNGDTSLKQESLLYKYYSSDDVVDDLQEYKTMFILLSDAAGEAEPHTLRVRPIPLWLGIAASLALILTIAVTFILPSRETSSSDCFAEVYAGSYVVRNGKRITDPTEIEQQIRLAERYIIEQDRMIDACINSYDDVERAVIEDIYPSSATRELIIKSLTEL